MYCKNCGKEIEDKAVICVYCGVRTGNDSASVSSNIMAIIGLICSFVLAPLGLVFGILGLRFANRNGGCGKGMSIAAIIISATLCAIFLIYIIIAIAISLSLANSVATMYGAANSLCVIVRTL